MKEDSPTGPIIFSGDSEQIYPLDPSNAEVRDYVVAMVDQLSKLASGNGEPLIGAMLAEVVRRTRD